MIFLATKRRCELDKPKMDRPTNNPKSFRIAVRLDKESHDVLETYCCQKKVTKMEAARRGIKKLKDDLN